MFGLVLSPIVGPPMPALFLNANMSQMVLVVLTRSS
jgi:hypothetical protein